MNDRQHPQARPEPGEGGELARGRRSRGPGRANSGPVPKSGGSASPPATLAATTRGTNARLENSNSSSSMASTTAASGAPKVAAIPAAAPLASRILRSEGETWMTWPSSEPSAPPVTMIGPSAPNGPPVPMAIAAESGLAMAVRGAIRLWLDEDRLHRLGDAVAPDDRRPLGQTGHRQGSQHRGDHQPCRWVEFPERRQFPPRPPEQGQVREQGDQVHECVGGRAGEGPDDGGQQGQEEQSARRGPKREVHRFTI